MSATAAKKISGIFDTPAAPAIQRRNTETKTRDGRKQTIFMMHAEAVKQLDFMALDNNTTRQALLTEAVNDLFLKYKKPPIA